jgi:hypothetical protein
MLKQRLIIIFAISIIGSSYAGNWFESHYPKGEGNSQFNKNIYNPEATNEPLDFFNALIHQKTEKYQSGKPYTVGQEVSEPCANLHAQKDNITVTKKKDEIRVVVSEHHVSKKDQKVLKFIKDNEVSLGRSINVFLNNIKSEYKTCSTPSTTGNFPQSNHALNLSAMKNKIQSCKPGMVGIKGGSGSEQLVVKVGKTEIPLKLTFIHHQASDDIKHEVALLLQHLLTSLINQCEKKLAHPVGF